jgi:spermidine dehydrogenase
MLFTDFGQVSRQRKLDLMDDSKDKRHDGALGMGERITRRDYLNSTLIASGSVLLGAANPLQLLGRDDWDGYGGIGDYGGSNGNTYDVMSQGHKIRDHVYEPVPKDISDTGEVFDCVVIGGGISGLSAALFLSQKEDIEPTCLVLENHAIFGGEARRNEFEVGGQHLIAHQGSAMWFPPLPNTFLDGFYQSINVKYQDFQYQRWAGGRPEMPVSLTPYFEGDKNSAFFFGQRFGQTSGKWVVDPWGNNLSGAPISGETKNELLRMRSAKPPQLPQQHGDAASRHMDSMSLEQLLMEHYGISRDTVRTFLSPLTGGGSGLGADALSGYAEYAADVLLPWQHDEDAQMFPGGNAGVARHIVKAMMPDVFPGAGSMAEICQAKVNFAALDHKGRKSRIRLRCTVVSVQHEDVPEKSKLVKIVYLRNGKLSRIRARSVVMAGGSWTAKHIVKNLPEPQRDAYSQFHRAPCLMANVAVRNWRFLYDMGVTNCRWFEGIGNYTGVRRTATIGDVSPTISPDSPVVLTLKILFSSPGLPLPQQVSKGRAELFSTSFAAYERQIREQFATMFASAGFDARRDIAGIILNRWGHAYLAPQPGFFFGQDGKAAPGDILRNNPFGRITFANSDLAGIMDHRTSILEAKRATDQALAALNA